MLQDNCRQISKSKRSGRQGPCKAREGNMGLMMGVRDVLPRRLSTTGVRDPKLSACAGCGGEVTGGDEVTWPSSSEEDSDAEDFLPDSSESDFARDSSESDITLHRLKSPKAWQHLKNLSKVWVRRFYRAPKYLNINGGVKPGSRNLICTRIVNVGWAIIPRIVFEFLIVVLVGGPWQIRGEFVGGEFHGH